MKVNLLIWVTSHCNLKCHLCMVKYSQSLMPDYEMGLEEVIHIINSSKERGFHYDMITLTGGEPTQWTYLKEGVRLFYRSGITDHISLISNGSHPQAIFEISEMLSSYAISATQASEYHLQLFRNSGHRIIYNNETHKELPIKPILDTLPARCCNWLDQLGREVNQVFYVREKVYYCCMVLVESKHEEITEDLCCSFEDDFIQYYKDKRYDKRICQYCLCNEKVWDSL